MRFSLLTTDLSTLPESPGVYTFRGTSNEVLYVGKSIRIRSRVRSHFNNRLERRMCKQVRSVDTERTAGELGALLLESRVIKELRPIHNVRSRHGHRLIAARRMASVHGYATVVLEAIDRIESGTEHSFAALFRGRMHAKEYLADIARDHRLCRKLLGLERTTRHCFGYHIGQCGGACKGEEPVAEYNARFDAAFEDRRIKAWPFDGAVIIEEEDEESGLRETFIVDNWCLLYSFVSSRDSYRLSVQGLHRFDYDGYKIVSSYVFNEVNAQRVRTIGREELDELVRRAFAA